MSDNHSHRWTPIYDDEGEIIGRICTDPECGVIEGRLA